MAYATVDAEDLLNHVEEQDGASSKRAFLDAVPQLDLEP